MSSSSLPPTIPGLIVTFADDERRVDPGKTLTFGRAADLVIDSANRTLHRVLGRFHEVDGAWWLTNEGRSVSLVVTDLDGASFTRLAPGAALPLPFASNGITFSAGKANYRLLVVNPNLQSPESQAAIDALTVHSTTRELTLAPGDLTFNDEQFQLLVVLAERRLAGPITSADLPTNRQMAQRLGWKITKVNRKLDNLCVKLDKAGVNGLVGSSSEVATDRRLRLADFVVEHGVVTPDSVAVLPPNT